MDRVRVRNCNAPGVDLDGALVSADIYESVVESNSVGIKSDEATVGITNSTIANNRAGVDLRLTSLDQYAVIVNSTIRDKRQHELGCWAEDHRDQRCRRRLAERLHQLLDVQRQSGDRKRRWHLRQRRCRHLRRRLLQQHRHRERRRSVPHCPEHETPVLRDHIRVPQQPRCEGCGHSPRRRRADGLAQDLSIVADGQRRLFSTYYDTGRFEVVESRSGYVQACWRNCIGFNHSIWVGIFASCDEMLALAGAKAIRTHLRAGGQDDDDAADVEAFWI